MRKKERREKNAVVPSKPRNWVEKVMRRAYIEQGSRAARERRGRCFCGVLLSPFVRPRNRSRGFKMNDLPRRKKKKGGGIGEREKWRKKGKAASRQGRTDSSSDRMGRAAV